MSPRPPPPLPWGKIALYCLVALPIGTFAFAAFGLTIGLITGLIVLMIPLYVLFLQATVTTLGVSLCLAAGLRRGAGVVGATGIVAPVVLAAAWYGGELWLCSLLREATSCVAYLHGDPPLVPMGLVAYGIVSSLGLLGFVVGLRRVS